MKINRYVYLITAIVIIVFNGCTVILKEPTPEIKPTVVEPVKKSIPNELLVKKDIPKPPNKEVFLNADYNNRMILLKDYLKELMLSLKESNDNLDKIKKWNDTK